MAKTAFKVHGMDCAEEVTLLKRELGPIVGGDDRLAFDILNAKLVVQFDEGQVTPEAIAGKIDGLGMRAEIWEDTPSTPKETAFWDAYGHILLTAASGLLGTFGFVIHVWQAGELAAAFGSEGLGGHERPPMISIIFYSLGILAGIWNVLPKAGRAARSLRPDMNLLMVIAVAGAVVIGEWFEAATVSFLFSLSIALEAWSVARARQAVAALMNVAPSLARVRNENGEETEIPVEEVELSSIFIVRPGERIPLDGRVVSGVSEVNQAPITGESVPVPKTTGTDVFAGTINGDGVLEIESTKPANDTTLARIIRMVGEAQSRRAPSEKWVEKFARVYTPVVLVVAVVVLLVPPLLFGGIWADWFYRALVLLVIACPCALVISTPVSIVAGLAAAARNGVLVKGGMYIEEPANLIAIALDKTGTLTEGKLSLLDIVPLSGHNEAELLERAAALESNSNHPIALAIVSAAKGRSISIPAVEELQTVQGKGLTGRIFGKPFWLGSHRYLEERKQETPVVHDRLMQMQQAGRTVVVIGNDQHVCGFITLADSLRHNARQAIDEMRNGGVKHIVMLTGDNEGTARAIAQQIGLDDVFAELLPEDKVKAVESLVGKYQHVAMVGDGINDAPALARASVGIAMGAAGTDAAIETADIALMSDDLLKIPWLIRHSRRTLSVIRQNIAFSLVVKAIFVILTFVGFASLWAAIAADTGASLIVIFNGLRLLKHSAEIREGN